MTSDGSGSLVEDLMNCESDLMWLLSSIEELVLGRIETIECFDENGNPIEPTIENWEKIHCIGGLEHDVKTIEVFMEKNKEVTKKALDDIKSIVETFKSILEEFTKP